MRTQDKEQAPIFNMGISYLQRIDYLLTESTKCKVNMDGERNFHIIWALYIECFNLLNQTETLQAINLRNFMISEYKTFQGVKNKVKTTPGLNFAIEELELHLRRCIKPLLQPKETTIMRNL